MACQLAANHNWTLTHIDIKTVFLQGDRYDDTRNALTALPKEAGYPPHMAARMKKPAYGLNDAPRRWFNIIDASLRKYECVPTRGDRCTYVLYSKTHLAKGQVSNSKSESPQIAGDEMLDRMLHPFIGNNSKGYAPCGVICLHVDDLFMCGNSEFEERVLKRLRKDYTIGSEDI